MSNELSKIMSEAMRSVIRRQREQFDQLFAQQDALKQVAQEWPDWPELEATSVAMNELVDGFTRYTAAMTRLVEKFEAVSAEE